MLSGTILDPDATFSKHRRNWLVIIFFPISRKLRNFIWHNDDGIVPEKWLLERNKLNMAIRNSKIMVEALTESFLRHLKNLYAEVAVVLNL